MKFSPKKYGIWLKDQWSFRKRLIAAQKQIDCDLALQMGQRAWNMELERDVKALRKKLDEVQDDPLAAAHRLLDEMDMILESKPLDNYLLLAWRGEFRAYRLRHYRASVNYL